MIYSKNLKTKHANAVLKEGSSIPITNKYALVWAKLKPAEKLEIIQNLVENGTISAQQGWELLNGYSSFE